MHRLLFLEGNASQEEDNIKRIILFVIKINLKKNMHINQVVVINLSKVFLPKYEISKNIQGTIQSISQFVYKIYW